jgi:23S rRNA (adenine2030-N6)-methyltransferase
MNYLQHYHCGNFADILKHSILSLFLEHYKNEQNQPSSSDKDSEIFIIDSHSGSGKYSIPAPKKQKDHKKIYCEAFDGLWKILCSSDKINLIPESLLNVISRINHCKINQIKDLEQIIYPGSPLIIKYLAPFYSKTIFCETNPEINQQLKRNFAGNLRFFVNNEDGFLLLKRNTIKERLELQKSIVFIDPSFEKYHHPISKDYQNISQLIEDLDKQFNEKKQQNQKILSTFIIWYPVILKQETREYNELELFYYNISKLPKDRWQNFICHNKNNTTAMKSCGILVFNAPKPLVNKIKNFNFNLQNFFDNDNV